MSTMSGVTSSLAMESLARIYGASKPGLPTIEFPRKYERQLRQIAILQGKIRECDAEKKKYEQEVEAHSVRIAELMKDHEHGVLMMSNERNCNYVLFVGRKRMFKRESLLKFLAESYSV